MGSLLQEIEYYRNGTVYDPEATQTILGVTYTSRGCYEKCVECDDTNSMGWMLLGRFGKGGSVHGKQYDKTQCCEEAVKIRSIAINWNALGCVGGGTVSSVAYCKKTCYMKALEIDPKYSIAWNNLGFEGGG
eukprot:PhF_6_TR10420/c3_g5_i3/m.16395